MALGLAGYNTLIVNAHIADRLGRLSGRRPGWGRGPHRLLTTVLVEAAVLLLAAVGAAVMTSVPTAREATPPPSAPRRRATRPTGSS